MLRNDKGYRSMHWTLLPFGRRLERSSAPVYTQVVYPVDCKYMMCKKCTHGLCNVLVEDFIL